MNLELRPVPIMTQYLRYRLDEYSLSTNSTSFTGDGTTKEFNLGTNIAMVKSVSVNGDIKAWYKDWILKWNSSGQGILEFEDAPPDASDISVTYTQGNSWIRYSPLELTADILPIIMLDTTFSPADRPYSIGLYASDGKKYWLHSIVITATVWFEQDKPYTYKGKTYWGDEFGYYIQDLISKQLIDDYDYLLERGIHFQNGYGLMRLMIGPEAEQPPYIARVQKNYVFHFYIPVG